MIDQKSLFFSNVEKRRAESEAQKIQNRILQLKQEHEKLIKKINQQDMRAEEIYMHRVELQLKKEEKMKLKKEQPPPFTLQVSRQQQETLKKIKETNLQKKKSEAKLHRELLKQDHKDSAVIRSLEYENFKAKALQIKEEEKQSNTKTLLKLQEKRNKIRSEIEYQKGKVLNEKQEYEGKIAELEKEEQEALQRLNETIQRQTQVNQKVKEAHELPPQEFGKVYKNQTPQSQQQQ